LKYIDTHYTGPRMALIGAGAVDHDELVKLAEKNFGGLSKDSKVSYKKDVDFTGSMVHVRNDDLPLVHTAIGMRGVGWSDPNYYILLLLQVMVGSWDRSLAGGKNLISRVCGKLATDGLAHSMISFNTCYNDTGLFGAYIVGEEENMFYAMKAVVSEWTRLSVGATDFEVENAKRKLKATCLMQLDSTQAIADDIGRQTLTIGRHLSPLEVFMRIDSITTEQVRDVAKHYFYDTDPAVAAVGNITGAFPDYLAIRQWTYWNTL